VISLLSLDPAAIAHTAALQVFPIDCRFPAEAAAATIDRIGRRSGEFFIPVDSH
jgi:hypothetical protein